MAKDKKEKSKPVPWKGDVNSFFEDLFKNPLYYFWNSDKPKSYVFNNLKPPYLLSFTDTYNKQPLNNLFSDDELFIDLKSESGRYDGCMSIYSGPYVCEWGYRVKFFPFDKINIHYVAKDDKGNSFWKNGVDYNEVSNFNFIQGYDDIKKKFLSDFEYDGLLKFAAHMSLAGFSLRKRDRSLLAKEVLHKLYASSENHQLDLSFFYNVFLSRIEDHDEVFDLGYGVHLDFSRYLSSLRKNFNSGFTKIPIIGIGERSLKGLECLVNK